MTQGHITFKTKLLKVDSNGTEQNVLFFKKTIGRADCNLRPCNHRHYNSDLFPILLNRAYQEIIHRKNSALTNDLPKGVTLEVGKFMSTVTIALPDNF